MLARLRGADGVLPMHAVRQTDVNGIYCLVLADAVEGLVGVDRTLRKTVRRRVFPPLGVRMPSDHGGNLCLLRAGARAREDIGYGSQPDRGEAYWLRSAITCLRPCRHSRRS